MTQAQAATTPYTVTDTDTLESVASQFKVDPTNVLDANPELKTLRTGMVINAPRLNPITPGSPGWQGSAVAGGLGLPSNAALGQTSANTLGGNPMQPGQAGWQGSAFATNPPQQTFQKAFGNMLANAPTPQQLAATSPIQQYANQPLPPKPAYLQPRGAYGQTIAPTGYNNPVIGANGQPIGRYGTFGQQLDLSTPQAAPRGPVAAPPTGQPQKTVFNSALPSSFQNYSMREETYHLDLFKKITAPGSTYNPTPEDLNYMQKMGLIKPATQSPAYQGGYGYGGGFRRHRRGGSGGGGRGYPRGGKGFGQPRAPAFSSGGGFNGLVNWRI